MKNRQPDAPDVVSRFLKYADGYGEDRCWLWTGGKSRGGNRFSARALYGTFNPGGVVKGGVRSHVYVAWLTLIIPRELPMRVPIGKNLDHTCSNSLCVNPGHLELVSSYENLERRWGKSRDMTGLPSCTMLVPFAHDCGRLDWLLA